MWRALVGADGATNNGTTIGPATPTGALWMWPAMNVSRAGLIKEGEEWQYRGSIFDLMW